MCADLRFGFLRLGSGYYQKVLALALAEQSRTELQEQSLSIINYWYVRLGYLDHCNDFLYT